MTTKQYPSLSEQVHTHIAPNGLTIKIVPRPGFTKKLVYFATDFGSIHRHFEFEGKEYYVPAGIAHFLEHKMFELPGRDVTGEFAALGANVNAFTSYDMTAYYFSCTEHFEENLSLLLEFVSTPYFPEESVRREMGIIDQEIGMNRDAPDSRVFEDLMKILYREHPIQVPILGNEETIREITPELLEVCHRAFYTPQNMILCLVGDVDMDVVSQVVDRVLGKQRKPMGKKLTAWQETMTARESQCHNTMEVAMPTFQMAFKCEPIGMGQEAMRGEIVGDLAAEALFGESSPLYLELYQKGMIDSSFGGGFESVDGCAMLTCGGDSQNPEHIREAILGSVHRLLENGLSQGDFLRMKRSAMGRRIQQLDSFDSTCFRMCAYHFQGFDYFDFPQVYAQVTQEEIGEFLQRTVLQERCALSIIYPKEELANE